MNGIKYWRLKNRMTLAELSDCADITITTVRYLEKKVRDTTTVDIYVRISDALGVTVDDLLIEYSDDALQDGDRPVSKHGGTKLINCIAMYRKTENLTLQQLAARMGVSSRERARQICNTPMPSRKNLLKLAEYENLSLQEFEVRYAVEEKEVCA